MMNSLDFLLDQLVFICVCPTFLWNNNGQTSLKWCVLFLRQTRVKSCVQYFFLKNINNLNEETIKMCTCVM